MSLEAGFFLVLKPSLFCYQTFVKVGFQDKATGFWAFEEHMLYYQKYQRSPTLVRLYFQNICIPNLCSYTLFSTITSLIK